MKHVKLRGEVRSRLLRLTSIALRKHCIRTDLFAQSVDLGAHKSCPDFELCSNDFRLCTIHSLILSTANSSSESRGSQTDVLLLPRVLDIASLIHVLLDRFQLTHFT
jgi:hypothetical protein